MCPKLVRDKERNKTVAAMYRSRRECHRTIPHGLLLVATPPFSGGRIPGLDLRQKLSTRDGLPPVGLEFFHDRLAAPFAAKLSSNRLRPLRNAWIAQNGNNGLRKIAGLDGLELILKSETDSELLNEERVIILIPEHGRNDGWDAGPQCR